LLAVPAFFAQSDGSWALATQSGEVCPVATSAQDRMTHRILSITRITGHFHAVDPFYPAYMLLPSSLWGGCIHAVANYAFGAHRRVG